MNVTYIYVYNCIYIYRYVLHTYKHKQIDVCMFVCAWLYMLATPGSNANVTPNDDQFLVGERLEFHEQKETSALQTLKVDDGPSGKWPLMVSFPIKTW